MSTQIFFTLCVLAISCGSTQIQVPNCSRKDHPYETSLNSGNREQIAKGILDVANKGYSRLTYQCKEEYLANIRWNDPTLFYKKGGMNVRFQKNITKEVKPELSDYEFAKSAAEEWHMHEAYYGVTFGCDYYKTGEKYEAFAKMSLRSIICIFNE